MRLDKWDICWIMSWESDKDDKRFVFMIIPRLYLVLTQYVSYIL